MILAHRAGAIHLPVQSPIRTGVPWLNCSRQAQARFQFTFWPVLPGLVGMSANHQCLGQALSYG
jgi:hypothetical protein